MKNLNVYLNEGFFKNIGAADMFSKTIVDTTYKYKPWKLIKDGHLHALVGTNGRSDWYYDIEPYDENTIKVTNMHGFRKYGILPKDELLIDFTSFIDEINRRIQIHSSKLEYFHIFVYTSGHRDGKLKIYLENYLNFDIPFIYDIPSKTLQIRW